MLIKHLMYLSVFAIMMGLIAPSSTLAQEETTPAGDVQTGDVPPELLGSWNISLGEPPQRVLPCWMCIEQKDGKLTARYNSWAAGMQHIPVEFKDGKVSFDCWTPGINGKDHWTGTLKVQGRGGRRASRANDVIEGTACGEKDTNTRKWVAHRQVIQVDATGTWTIDTLKGLPKAERKLLIKQERWRVRGRLVEGDRSEEISNGRVRYGVLAARVQMRGPDEQSVLFTVRATVKGDVLQGAFVDGEKKYAFTAQRTREWEQPIVLFDGKNMDEWKPWDRPDGFRWEVIDGALCTPKPGKDIMTERKFKDFKLHIEFKVPENGNSGVYLRGRHEVQVADSFGKPLTLDSCGAVYGRIIPKINACKKAGEWQSYDITLIGMYLTVKLNDQTIIDNQLLEGMTGGAMDNDDNAPGPFYLQGDHSPICYRNIQITPVKTPEVPKGLE